MLTQIPLMIIPFLGFNAVLVWWGQPTFASGVFTASMMSGGIWTMTVGDCLIVIALAFLFFEIMKSTRTNNASIVDHLLSTFVFVACLVEFLLVPGAATSLFFILMMITLIDVIAGFSVSIRSAGRDVSFN